MQAYHYALPKYQLPPPRYLPPPPHIPLSEDEYGAQYIPSRLMGPLLDFEVEPSVIAQKVGDCIARKLTELQNSEDLWIYKLTERRYMRFTNASDTKGIWVLMPEFANDELDQIDFRDPTSWQHLENITSEYLSLITSTEIPVTWKLHSQLPELPDYANFIQQPSYWKKAVEFMEKRTPAFIQKVRDELSRRYIFMTGPQDPELERQFLKALESCRLSLVLTNLEKVVNVRQRRIERHGLTEVSHFKGLPPNMTWELKTFLDKTKIPRKTQKARRRKLRKTRRQR
jgi:hypothetical protein